MLYLEDYLELIEHLPKELSERLTRIRTNDLEVDKVDTKVKQFFADAKKLDTQQRQCEYENVLKIFERTTKYADQKVELADKTHEIMQKLVQKLDGELEKFKLELEADHAGITEQIERRSLEVEADNRLNATINSHLNNSHRHRFSASSALSAATQQRLSNGLKDRRRSEHKHQLPYYRHHPYIKPNNSHHLNNGYPVRAKLSHHQQQLHDNNTSKHNLNSKQMPPNYYQKYQTGSRFVNGHHHDNSISASSPIPFGVTPATRGPGSMADDFILNRSATDLDSSGGGHYGSNLNSFGNDSGFKSAHKNHHHNNNLPYSNQHHSALSAALSSATMPSPQSISNMDLSAIQQHSTHKISTHYHREKVNNLIDPNSPLVGQNPLAAAASQAIAATQQLHQGRRTSSLKASFAAVSAAGFGTAGGKHLDHAFHNNKDSLGRNALAPMAPDQQAYRYSQHYGKLSNGNSSPLYVSVTKSGRPSKRPKHHASHLYPDESPTSISSDNSVFENSESMSSADFIDAGTAFDSASPSFDYTNSSRVSDQTGASAFYQRDETKYCICRQISYGEMVACDNEECEIEWFHYNCVGITQTPKGKWYCPGCASKMDLHHHNTSSQETQTHKKRGRKELMAN